MRFFGLPGAGPYMGSDRGLPNPDPSLLVRARYQIVPGPRGLPTAQVGLQFRREIPAVANPEMSLALLIDRSGSMREAFNAGHVYNLALTVFSHVNAAGAGYECIFYDDRVSDAGRVEHWDDVRRKVQDNPPRGGTMVTAALRRAVQGRPKGKGIYIIVITDGEFSDKAQARQYLIDELVPLVTPDNPYAIRLHFVGAGEGVDHAFLRQIEADASGQGVQLLTQHHHAHLSHSHNDILDELDRAFLGVALDARFGDPAALAGGDGGGSIVHTVDAVTRRSWDGPVGSPGFLPRRALLAAEYGPNPPERLPLEVQFRTRDGQRRSLTLPIPMPRSQTAAAAPRPSGFRWPWQGGSSGDETARAAERARRETLDRLAAANAQAEQVRQAHDLRALAQGGLPAQAEQRLKELGAADGQGALFTSDLTPEEAGLLRREGWVPRGLVTGSAMYHVGQAYASSQSDCEVQVLSAAYDDAMRLAVARMRQELLQIGAHGVVGVRFTLTRHEWAEKTIEVQVVGTAVQGPGDAPTEPFLCDLSGQEWWALRRAGYEPAALVWGHCTWFILTTQADEAAERSWSNQELTHWSHALGRARTRAMNQVKERARNSGAHGVAGVRIERRLDEVRLTGPGEDPAYEREHHNLVVSVLGTAIRLRRDAPAGVRPTGLALSLLEGRLAPAALNSRDVRII